MLNYMLLRVGPQDLSDWDTLQSDLGFHDMMDYSSDDEDEDEDEDGDGDGVLKCVSRGIVMLRSDWLVDGPLPCRSLIIAVHCILRARRIQCVTSHVSQDATCTIT